MFETEFREISQKFNSIRQPITIVWMRWMSWNFCKVSWTFLSNRCWKFQLPILKNKKVLFLKKKNHFLAVINIKTKKLCLLNKFSVKVLCISKKTSVPFQPFRKKVMLHCILLFSFFSPIQSWILPPGSFLSEFATSHDRASITVYLPTSEFSTKSIRNNQKYVTSILEFDTQSNAQNFHVLHLFERSNRVLETNNQNLWLG